MPKRSKNSSTVGWADIPDVLLISIFHRLHNHRDLFSAASVCRSWRSIAANSHSSKRPPLLLLGSPNMSCQLLSPAASPYAATTSPFLFKPQAQHRKLIGSSRGRLLFSIDHSGHQSVILANVFTGVETRTPRFPSPSYSWAPFVYACVVGDSDVICCTKFSLLRLRIGELAWEKYRLDSLDAPVVQILEFGDDLFFALDAYDRVFEFSFKPAFSSRQLLLQWPEENCSFNLQFRKQLVECDGKVMAVVGMLCGPLSGLEFSVYWLDLSRMEWVKVESLGDWALFVGCLVRTPFACQSPSEWGGRSNCIYSINFGSDTWSVVPLGARIELEFDSDTNGFFRRMTKESFHWPLPIWVYPGTFHSI